MVTAVPVGPKQKPKPQKPQGNPDATDDVDARGLKEIKDAAARKNAEAEAARARVTGLEDQLGDLKARQDAVDEGTNKFDTGLNQTKREFCTRFIQQWLRQNTPKPNAPKKKTDEFNAEKARIAGELRLFAEDPSKHSCPQPKTKISMDEGHGNEGHGLAQFAASQRHGNRQPDSLMMA